MVCVKQVFWQLDSEQDQDGTSSVLNLLVKQMLHSNYLIFEYQHHRRFTKRRYFFVSCVCCVLSDMSLREADNPFSGDLPGLTLCVWSRNLNNKVALAQFGLLRPERRRKVVDVSEFCSACLLRFYSILNMVCVVLVWYGRAVFSRGVK